MNTIDFGITGPLCLLAGAFRDLLLPRGCAGCDVPDEVLCPRCMALFDSVHTRILSVNDKTRCYACAQYEGAARRAILAWKDHGDEECDDAFARCLARLVLRMINPFQGPVGGTEAIAQNVDICGIPDVNDMHGVREILLVPAPSSPASMRRRGRWQMAPLAKRAAKILNDSGMHAKSCPILRLEGVRGKSVQTSGSLARSQRIQGHVRAVDAIYDESALVFIMDDIVTTGSTMGQCVTALRAAGARYVVGLALACTPMRR